MDFALNDEQQMLHESARRFFADNHPLSRARNALPWADAAQKTLWSDMANMGWMALLAPESMDGLGLGLTDAYLVAEAAGHQLLNLPWNSSAVLLPLWLRAEGTEHAPEALSALVQGILAGERAAHCVAEQDRLRDYVAQCTDVVVVRGMHDDAQPLQIAITHSTSADEATWGLDPTLRQSTANADAALSWHTLSHVSAEDRAHARRAYRLMQCAELIGVAQAALQLGADYAKERVQFGKPIGSYQAIKHQLANAWMAVDNARLSALYASAALDGHLPDTAFACAASEYTAIEGALHTTRTVIQVHGGMGFTWEHDAHLYLKRAQHLAARLGGASKALTQVEALALA